MTIRKKGGVSPIMEILEYAFMQRAFVVGILLALIIPCIGMTVVFRRLSMIGDALAHVSLAGVAAGLVFNINPILGAVAATIAAAFGIEAIRKRLPHFSELSIAVMFSLGVGLAAVLSSFVGNSASLHSFLFGSIVAITNFELWLVVGLSVTVLLVFIILYQEIFLVVLDERSARLAGVSVDIINVICTILTAVTVSVAARMVGALIVSSMMVVPVACAMQVARSYKQTLFISQGFALCFMVAGLFISYYANIRPGGAIVLTGVVCLFVILFFRWLVKR